LFSINELGKREGQSFAGFFTSLTARAEFGLCSVNARSLLAYGVSADCFTLARAWRQKDSAWPAQGLQKFGRPLGAGVCAQAYNGAIGQGHFRSSTLHAEHRSEIHRLEPWRTFPLWNLDATLALSA